MDAPFVCHRVCRTGGVLRRQQFIADRPFAGPHTPTRIIGVTGNLAFGDVAVGSSRDLTMTITNTGSAVLTVSSLSVSGGLVTHTTASWTSGTIAADGSQQDLICGAARGAYMVRL